MQQYIFVVNFTYCKPTIHTLTLYFFHVRRPYNLNSIHDKIFVDLLEKWKNKSTIIPCVAIHHALKKKGMKQQPPTVIVNLSLEFDYNAQTFLLAEEPSAVPLCLLPQLYQDNVSKTYQELRENACKKGLSSNY